MSPDAWPPLPQAHSIWLPGCWDPAHLSTGHGQHTGCLGLGDLGHFFFFFSGAFLWQKAYIMLNLKASSKQKTHSTHLEHPRQKRMVLYVSLLLPSVRADGQGEGLPGEGAAPSQPTGSQPCLQSACLGARPPLALTCVASGRSLDLCLGPQPLIGVTNSTQDTPQRDGKGGAAELV